MNDEARQRRFIVFKVESERSVRRLLRVLVWDAAILDDVCLAVALRLWELFDFYDAARPFDVWALGVASKVALEMNRSRRRAGPVLPPDVVTAVVEGFERNPFQRLRSVAGLRRAE